MKRFSLGLLVVATIVALVGMGSGQVTGKYFGFTSDRYWDNNGNFRTDGAIEAFGSSGKVRLTYSEGTYTDITENSSGNIYIAKNLTNGDSSRILYLDGSPTLLTDGARQGTLVVNVNRAAGYAMTTSGGASDLGARITVTNRSASADYARIRGLEINVETRDSGAGSYLQEGAYIGVKSRSGTSINAAGDLIAIKAETNHGATGGNNVIGLMVNMIDQAVSPGGGYYGIKIQTGNYNVTRANAIHIGSTAGSFTNAISFNDAITNAFVFEDADLTNGASYAADYDDQDAQAVGNIKIKIGSNTLYLYAYANAAHKN